MPLSSMAIQSFLQQPAVQPTLAPRTCKYRDVAALLYVTVGKETWFPEVRSFFDYFISISLRQLAFASGVCSMLYRLPSNPDRPYTAHGSDNKHALQSGNEPILPARCAVTLIQYRISTIVSIRLACMYYNISAPFQPRPNARSCPRNATSPSISTRPRIDNASSSAGSSSAATKSRAR